MEFRDKDFSGQEVLLDGNIFTGCTFRNCRVIYRADGGRMGFGACHFKENIEWIFEGHAARAINFLAAMYKDTEKGGRKAVEDMLKNTRWSGS